MCLEIAKRPSSLIPTAVSFRVLGGGGDGLTFPRVFRGVRLDPSVPWKSSWKERSIYLLSSSPDIPPLLRMSPLPDPIQLLSGIASAETHTYHSRLIQCFRGDL